MRPVALDVGQCDYDHGRIKALLELVGCQVRRAHTGEQARAVVAEGTVSLVLVNRILDGDGADGVALIAELVRLAGHNAARCSIMLVSNYPEYQENAVSVGAMPGFGKSDLELPETAQKILSALRG